MSRGQRWLLWTSAVASFASGLVYACIRYLMDSDDPFSAFNHPLQPWALDTHVLVAPVVLFAVGWFWGNHVAPKLTRGKRTGRSSGVVLLGLVALMTVSGYLLQTTTNPALKSAIAWTHGISGALFFTLLVGHLVSARRTAAARGQREVSRAAVSMRVS